MVIRTKGIYLCLLLLGLISGACEKKELPTTAPTSANPNLFELISSDPECSIFAQAIVNCKDSITGFYRSRENITALVPTNQAFEDYFARSNKHGSIDNVSVHVLRDMLRYLTITDGALYNPFDASSEGKETFQNQKDYNTITTTGSASQQRVITAIVGSGTVSLTNIGYDLSADRRFYPHSNDTVTLVTPAKQTGRNNSTYFKIDKVMLPYIVNIDPTNPLYAPPFGSALSSDVVSITDSPMGMMYYYGYDSMFRAALIARLNTSVRTGFAERDVKDSRTIHKSTLFAPSNEAWASFIASVDTVNSIDSMAVVMGGYQFSKLVWRHSLNTASGTKADATPSSKFSETATDIDMLPLKSGSLGNAGTQTAKIQRQGNNLLIISCTDSTGSSPVEINAMSKFVDADAVNGYLHSTDKLFK